MKKNMLSLMITLCMVVSLAAGSCIPVMAQGKTLVALGDSITTGYGLPGYTTTPMPYAPDSFVSLLAAKFQYTPVNMAIDGLTASQFASGLKAVAANPANPQYQAIKGASVISISIGGNDLLGALFLAVGTKFQMNPISPTFQTDVIDKLKTIIQTQNPNDLQSLNEAITSMDLQAMSIGFESALGSMIASLKTISPSTMIIVQTIPNPYKSVPNLPTGLEPCVQAFNRIINAHASQQTYYIADTYTAFNGSTEVLTNASDPKMFLDPHPNKAGHALIAATVAAYFETKTTSVSVQVAWENDTMKIRPTDIKVQLYKDGTAYDAPVSLTEAMGWQTSWKNLDPGAAWTVDEVPVPNGYTKNVSSTDSTFTITNTHTHTWNNGVVTTKPTVDKEGVKTFTCTVCGAVRTEAIAKLSAPLPVQPPKATPTSPKTGDHTSVAWSVLLGVSTLSLFAVIRKKSKPNFSKDGVK